MTITALGLDINDPSTFFRAAVFVGRISCGEAVKKVAKESDRQKCSAGEQPRESLW